MPAIDIDRDTAHEAAARELAKPIYPQSSLSERVLDWLDTELSRLMLKAATIPGGWLTISILAILAVLAVIAVIWIANRTLRTGGGGGGYELFDLVELSAAEHRATAERFAAAGDWASAIRHRLRAVARQLEESGALNPVPGRTANELARDAGFALPQLRTELSSAADTFNDVTYGELPGTEAGYRMIAELDDHLRSSASPSSPAALSSSAEPDTWAHVR